jgi:hypothetical protein
LLIQLDRGIDHSVLHAPSSQALLWGWDGPGRAAVSLLAAIWRVLTRKVCVAQLDAQERADWPAEVAASALFAVTGLSSDHVCPALDADFRSGLDNLE